MTKRRDCAHAAQSLPTPPTVQQIQLCPSPSASGQQRDRAVSVESVSETSSVTAHQGSQRRVSQTAALKQVQGVAVGQLPAKVAEAALKQQLTDLLTASRAKCKLINISFEQAGDATRALLLLQDVSDVDLLIAELNQHSLPSKLNNQRLKARLANQNTVTDAYNAYLATRPPNNSLSRADSTSSSASTTTKLPDARQKEACRTLYVGNLDKHCKEDWLRSKFSEFGHILEVDIKNRESFSPFAFIQFTNIDSVVRAIISNQNSKQTTGVQRNDRSKLKLNFGKAIVPSTRVWIGALPTSCSQEYLFFRLRHISPDGVQEVDYDSTNHEALITFKNVEQAQIVYNKIKSRQFVIPPEKPQKDAQSYLHHVDFASEKLYDFFSDRRHGRYRSSSLISTGTESPSTSQQKKSGSLDPTTTKKRPSSREQNNVADSSNEESLLAPPPDPPQLEAEPMSSRHKERRSNSRRSSPDQSRHRRDWDRDRYERRNDSRSYSSRYRDKRREKKKREARRHHHRSRSSESSVSSSSSTSRSSASSSSSSMSRNSIKSASKLQKNKNSSSISPPIQSPALMLGHFQPPPSFPKNLSSFKRSDAVDSTFTPTSSLDFESGRTKSTTVQQKHSIPKSAPTGSSNKPDFKAAATTLIHHYWNTYSKTNGFNVKSESDRNYPDPRLNNENYRTYTSADQEPGVYFPSFFLDDEFGRQYCHRMQNVATQRRNSQASSTNTTNSANAINSANSANAINSTSTTNVAPPWIKPESTPIHHHHPSISRSNSGSDHSKTPANIFEMPIGLPGIGMPLTFPFPPPPPGMPLESLNPMEVRQRSDSNADNNYFNERLQSISSKVNSITGRTSVHTPTFPIPPPLQQKPSIEDDLQRFKLKLNYPAAKSGDSSQSSTPTLISKNLTTPPSRLTINIPASTSNSSTPNIGSPALHSQQPTPSPASLSATSVGRSMSFSQNNLPTVETPPITSSGLGPRSSSYNFANSSNSLPLPPQPPTLQLSSARSDKVLSPKSNSLSTTHSVKIPLASPTAIPSAHSTPSNHSKTESTPTLTIKQAAVSKSAVTSPLTTPSTPRSASSLNDSKTPVPSHRDSLDLSDEAKRKKQHDKIKLFQSIKVPKKPRDSNPAEEIFSFSSPLSRIPHNLPQGAQHPAMSANKPVINHNKSLEKPPVKHPSMPTLSRMPTLQAMQKPEKKEKKSMDEKEKMKPSKSSAMLLTKTDSKGHKTSVLASLSEKDRRNSESLIENEMKKIQEKAARKFPNDEKEREKYVRKKQEKLRQRAEEVVLRQKERQKEIAKKSVDETQKKMSKKSLEHKSSTQSTKSALKEAIKEKELRMAKEKLKEKLKESAAKEEKLKQKLARKRRERTPSSGSDDESEEDNSSEILAECGLRQSDLEMQRILFEEAKAGQLNLSMYERVRRRRMANQPEENKKSQTLEMLRESKKKEKKTKRVQLSSDDESDSNAANSHKHSKPSASENSDSDHSNASTAASSASALKAKKLAKLEQKKREKMDKRRRSKEKMQISKKLKKMIKKEKSSDDDMSNDEEMVVKKLKKNLSSYNNVSDESENDSIMAKGRPKKKSISKIKSKKSLLGDDDFGDSDLKKDVGKIYTGKPGRPREKNKLGEKSSKLSLDKLTDEIKSREHKEQKEIKKLAKKIKQNEDEKSDEPIKKKPKTLSIGSVKSEVHEEKDKKRRASSEIENMPSLKRSKPEQLLTTTMAKMSPTIEEFSPTQSTASDGVRLENFVTQSCEPKNITPLISPLTSGRFGPASTERADSPPTDLQSKRSRTSSSSSTGSSSGSSTCTSTSVATSTTKKSTLSRQHSDTSSKTVDTSTKLQTFQFVKAVDENAAKTSPVSVEQAVENSGPAKQPSPQRLIEELQFENVNASEQPPSVGNQEDSDNECENLLLQQLDQKEASSTNLEEPMVAERSQETEDAVESLSAFMNANQPRSEDEEDLFGSTLMPNRGDRLSHSSTQSAHILSPKTDQISTQQEGFAPTVLPAIATTKETSPQHCPPDPAPTIYGSEVDPQVAAGKVSPISSTIQKVVHGNSFENIATTTPISEQKAQAIVSTVASAIPSHLPTPPPSRSSGGSPVTQYPAQQQSPLIASKTAQPVAQSITGTAQKCLSDGAIQPPVAQQMPVQDYLASNAVQQPQQSPIVSGSQLPPNMAELHQQILSQRGAGLSENEFAAFASELAKKQQYIQTSMAAQQTPTAMSFAQPTQQRSRAGSQSAGNTAIQQQRKIAPITTVSSSPASQQFAAAVNRNIATTPNQLSNTSITQSPITANPQNVVSPNSNQLEALLGPLSQVMSMNPAINNPIVIQQLLSSPQFIANLPNLLANPQAMDMFLRQYQLPPQFTQQTTEMDKILKNVMQIVGPNATPEAIHQTMFAMMQQEQRRQQEQELIEKQKQLVYSQYENAMRGARVMPDIVQQPQIPISQLANPVKQASGLDSNRYPICWQGNLVLKSNGTSVQMHHVSGNQFLLDVTASELSTVGQDGFHTLRINQRMKLQNPHLISVCNKMNDQNEFVALICLPCGQNVAQLNQETSKMTHSFY
ncbi:hypothetical protein M3Y97_00601500 [Aphelenchoides bicaudatus]|nr:hypothetical protein M3Y97_00601500 [Aphelenchoides bicaudatus]